MYEIPELSQHMTVNQLFVSLLSCRIAVGTSAPYYTMSTNKQDYKLCTHSTVVGKISDVLVLPRPRWLRWLLFSWQLRATWFTGQHVWLPLSSWIFFLVSRHPLHNTRVIKNIQSAKDWGWQGWLPPTSHGWWASPHFTGPISCISLSSTITRTVMTYLCRGPDMRSDEPPYAHSGLTP